MENTYPKINFSQLDILSKIVINIPLINVISAFSVQMLGRDALHLGNIRAFVFFFIIIISISIYGFSGRITKRIFFFMIYLFTLILFSSDFIYSLTGTYLKVLVTMLMFPVGFFVLSDYPKMILFLKNFTYASLLLCVNYIIAQIFNIGRSVYLDDSFYYGYAGIGSTVVLSYFLLSTPILKKAFTSFAGNIIFKVVIFLSVLFTIIALKRIAILALVVGFMVYMFKTRKIKRGLKTIFLMSFLLFITSPFYIDVFNERLEVRTTEDNELDQEQRYFDIIYAYQDFKTKGIRHALIGTEAFNTPGYFGRDRQVHVDYANLLIGTGIIGLGFYLWIYVGMYKQFQNYYKKIKNHNLFTTEIHNGNLQELNGTFTAILIASLIVSFSGGLHVITTRSILFTILGMLSGLLYKQILLFKKTKE